MDEKLSFAEHAKEAIIKDKRGIGIIRFLSKYVSRNVLDQMYKLYVRPHIDYGDVIYHDQSMPLSRKLESTQYKAGSPLGGKMSRLKNFRQSNWLIELSPRKNVEPRIVGIPSTFCGSTFFRLVEIWLKAAMAVSARVLGDV